MKAITTCQPYAELIASGAKRIENRTWSTSYRGELAIHAGKRRPRREPLAAKGATGRSRISRGMDAAPTSLGDENGTKNGNYVFGAVVAIVKLTAVLRLDELMDGKHPEYSWLLSNPYAEGPWCWVLEDVRRVEPVYCKGFQGLWNWDRKNERLVG